MGEMTSDERIAAFWDLARFHAKLNAAPSYFGPTTLEVVTPPAWSWSEDPGEADAFVDAALAREEAVASTPLSAYDGELPPAGTLSILCDGDGQPRALLETVEVELRDDDVVEHYRVVYAGD
ncbi:MAG TPA: hypothetical protein VF728_02840 [Nocardioides sp.]